MMRSPIRQLRHLSAAVLLGAILAGAALFAQQIDPITRGTGGVGRLLIGFGTDGAATLVNARTTLTNAQVLALNTTAVTVAAAPGAGYVIDVLDGMLIFNYTAAYTESTNVRLWYTHRQTGPAASNVIEMTGFLDATADAIIAFSGTPDDTRPSANTLVSIHEVAGTAFGAGNASNQVFVDVTYMIRRTGL